MISWREAAITLRTNSKKNRRRNENENADYWWEI